MGISNVASSRSARTASITRCGSSMSGRASGICSTSRLAGSPMALATVSSGSGTIRAISRRSPASRSWCAIAGNADLGNGRDAYIRKVPSRPTFQAAPATVPPSTGIDVPVTNDARSDARTRSPQRTRRSIPSGAAVSGGARSTWRSCPQQGGIAGRRDHVRRDTVDPDARPPSSRASVFVNCSTAAFMAA